MQRFRRKSELRGSKKEESTASASPDPPAISAPPTLELPELASFRTSLILVSGSFGQAQVRTLTY